jgi:hypothetical protein
LEKEGKPSSPHRPIFLFALISVAFPWKIAPQLLPAAAAGFPTN